MKKVDIEEVPAAALSDGPGRRALDEALGTTDVAIKYYVLDPGEVFSGGFHTHHDQEEIFVLIEGEAVWDTEAGEAAITLSAGEALRAPPGEFHHGYVPEDADGPARAIALGAPPGMDETVSVFTCPACGEEAKHDVDIDQEQGISVTECRECGNTIRTELGD
jgi:mannose-6-phosphate isomerase-like protein (cupin superfamily)